LLTRSAAFHLATQLPHFSLLHFTDSSRKHLEKKNWKSVLHGNNNIQQTTSKQLIRHHLNFLKANFAQERIGRKSKISELNYQINDFKGE